MYELKLKEIRKAKGLTQGELAKMVGLTLRVISSYERGETEVPLYVAFDICDALGCTVNELAGRK